MSKDPIQAEIQAAIEKHLPTQVGSALQERLNQANREHDELAVATEKNAYLLAELNNSKQAINELQGQLARHAELDEREAAIIKREITAEVLELKTQLTAEKESKEFARSVALGLVRNTEYRQHREGLVPMKSEYTDSYGHTQSSVSVVPVSLDESHRAE